jgi:hypothetical protein
VIIPHADVAQLAEHPFRKWAVVGSNPTIGSHSSGKQEQRAVQGVTAVYYLLLHDVTEVTDP